MHEFAGTAGPKAAATPPRGTLDELDLALVNALQMAPRAPWAQLARPLGVDAATLSRRWSRLRESEAAWVTCHASPSQVTYAALALIEVSCLPQAREALAGQLARHPQAMSVELVAGSCDLLLTVATASMPAMSAYVLALARIETVTGTRTHLVQHVHRDGSEWRMDSLSRDQRRDLAEAEDGSVRSAGARLTSEDRGLLLALAEDGRRSVTSIAAALDRPESTVRRLVHSLLHSGRAVLRCDAAHLHAGWRSTATLWMSVPPAQLVSACEELGRLRSTRMAASVSAEANLLSVVWLHALDDLARYEVQAATRIPSVRVLNRAVNLRWVKRMGRLLGEDGRSVGCVPIDPWHPVD
ncbi:Lrp/AsnC family transcriptional regulator [Streptomyces sp. TRM66268-LWL]|uniref:Lrp/AsnC family transcriptional regulator n=1 Tax=Streptomyces polyasparticus TaxID=2767826 RepID=A0ABR7SCK2_9ACTN|nr:Lrp/AsnC family transcriptional regulator [Streptomyces polyasparticus]MBC9713211.1 Lrp/AsnC family transcriptional regulator [Streptomyces polyasparticus]